MSANDHPAHRDGVSREERCYACDEPVAGVCERFEGGAHLFVPACVRHHSHVLLSRREAARMGVQR